MGRIDLLRSRVAAVMNAEVGELAATGSTTDGVNAALAALDLGPGDEVVTSDEEHPGVLAPLGALRERRGVSVRVVPFAELAAAVGPRHPAGRHLARLVAHGLGRGRARRSPPPTRWCCSTAPRASAPCPSTCASWAATSTPPRGRNGCAARTGSATCTCAASSRRACPPPGPSYGNLADATRALEFELQPDARRFALGFPAPHQVDWALAALDVLEGPGWRELQAHAIELAAQLAQRLGSRVRRRGDSTLVAWEVDEPEAEVERARGGGLRGARPAGDRDRARVGRRLVERGSARPARRAHLSLRTTIPNTTEASTTLTPKAPIVP